jgi:hypothetical protein
LLAAIPSAIAAEPTYYKEIRSILRKNCTVCHSEKNLDDPDASGRLSLATPERVLQKTTPVVVSPGKPDKSSLYTRLLSKDLEKRMPKDGEALSAEEVKAIKRWIELGAPLGDADSAAAYHRRETGSPRRYHDLTIPLGVTPPPGLFAGKGTGPLKLVAPLAPLAPITAVAFSPDNRFLACGSFRRVVVWNRERGDVVATKHDPIGMVQALAFSPDGKTLWIAGGESAIRGELKAYRTSDWQPAAEFAPSPDVLTGMAISPDGRRIACVGYDRQLRMFDLAPGKESWSVKAHSDTAFCVAFSRDGKELVTGGKDKAVKIWNSETGKSDRTLNGHRDEVYAVAFSDDGKTVFSSGLEPQIRKWNLAPNGKMSAIGGHGIALYQIAWSRDYLRFVTAGADRLVKIWKPDGTTDKQLAGSTEIVYSAALSPDASVAAE